jgi:hopanoid biosynthesis associated RND transporter like protein HpnN
VIERIDEQLGRWLAQWVDGVRVRASGVTTWVLVASLPLAIYAALGLGINSDTVSLVSRDLPALRNHDRFAALFPNLEHAFLIVIDAQSPELAREAADGLAEALARRTDRFSEVYLPGGGAFFERNGLLYRSVDELEQFADQMAEIQPIIAELERAPRLVNLISLTERGLAQARLVETDAERWSEILDRVGQATVRVYDEYPIAISWEEILLRGSAIELSTRRVLVAHPILDYSRVLAASGPLEVIRETAAELGFTRERGIRVRVTGNPVLNYEEMIGLAWDIGGAGVFCFLLVALLLRRALRSLRLAVAAIATLLVGLIWTAAFATATVGHLNVISMAFGILFIGLGVDFCIHLGMRYADLLRGGFDPAAALREATRSVGSSLVICAVTTAIGFFVFVPTSYKGVSELGLISGGGMLVILFLALTFFPALISSWLAIDPERDLKSEVVFRGEAPHMLGRHARAVRWGALAVGVGSVALLPQVRFDLNAVGLRDPSTESVQAFNDLLGQAGAASPWFVNAVSADLDRAVARARDLAALDVVESAVTLDSYIPSDQEEKLAILEDVAFFLDPTGASPDRDVKAPSVEEQIAALRDLHDFLATSGVDDVDGALAASVIHLRVQLASFLERVESDGNPAAALATLEQILLAQLPDQIARLRRAATAPPVAREDLPAELVSRMVAADGQARIQVFPRKTLRDDADLRAFIETVRELEPEATGIAVNLIAFAGACQEAFRQALGSAVIAIALLLLALWRSGRDTLLVLTPLFLAAAGTVGSMVLAGVAFNFANLVVIPLLFGIGVDSGIHLVHRAKTLKWGGEDLMGTTTARAVLYSALTTTVSFGTLALSSHRGIQSLGVLLIFGMAMTLAANLVVLPALLDAWRPTSDTEA